MYLTYLNNYLTNPKDLYMEVQLILRQLDYQHEGGRLTATEILNSLLVNIPEVGDTYNIIFMFYASIETIVKIIIGF